MLYLKNLSPRVKERDLISLFARFQEKKGPLIQFQMMTGRMRGQAFITFPSEYLHQGSHSIVASVHEKPLLTSLNYIRTLAHGRGPGRKIYFQYSLIFLPILASCFLWMLHKHLTLVSSVLPFWHFLPTLPVFIYFCRSAASTLYYSRIIHS